MRSYNSFLYLVLKSSQKVVKELLSFSNIYYIKIINLNSIIIEYYFFFLAKFF